MSNSGAGRLSQTRSRSLQAGLKNDLKSSKEAEKLSSEHSGFLYFTAGVHPHEAKHFTDETSAVLRTLLENPQCVAVGECGLDFNRNFSSREDQLSAFEKQVALACELQKPLFIHEREASVEMVEILEKYADQLPRAVIHCFTGTADEAKKDIDMGLYIGLTGFLWKDRSDKGVRYALENGIIPLERLLLETDAPYMYPKINDKKVPATVRETFTEKVIFWF
ncbi:hypothetical protein L596_024562 [Steinernema carpocapsae]|uniref:Deoxyribonuclease TATDN1 n=1 Tax=Steinernema carpocapsae TaxID=34508 RepID=A0A4U5MH39_STECR|nr:hypothetical protein L596_024562 [Steinernema carpocapsae]